MQILSQFRRMIDHVSSLLRPSFQSLHDEGVSRSKWFSEFIAAKFLFYIWLLWDVPFQPQILNFKCRQMLEVLKQPMRDITCHFFNRKSIEIARFGRKSASEREMFQLKQCFLNISKWSTDSVYMIMINVGFCLFIGLTRGKRTFNISHRMIC